MSVITRKLEVKELFKKYLAKCHSDELVGCVEELNDSIVSAAAHKMRHLTTS